MSGQLLQSLLNELNKPELTKSVSQQLNVDDATAKKAMGAALPLLLGGVNKNAQTESGAEKLHKALQKDHANAKLDDLKALLESRERQAEGNKIVGHVFGNNAQKVSKSVEKSANLGEGGGDQLMAMLAPLVMGFLGNEQSQGGMDVSALVGMLGNEQAGMGDIGGMVSGLLGGLDKDGDGDVMDDLDIGSILGGLLG